MSLFRKSLWPLVTLYCGRMGSAVVGLLLLPMFNRLLGAQQFGAVAIILSLQGLLVVLDLGLSISAGRDLAGADALKRGRSLIAHAERSLAKFYVGLFAVGLVASALGVVPLDFTATACAVVLFGAVTYQNVCQSALLARQDYVWVGTSQLLGTLLRNVVALFLMQHLRADLDVFCASQAGVAVLHGLITKRRFIAMLPSGEVASGETPHRHSISMPLLIQTISGACALQLDKPILGAFAGQSHTAPYFLAMVLAMTPITFLAGPVVQFYQPKIIAALHAGALPSTLMRKLLVGVLAAALAPGAVLWFGAAPFAALWLHGAPNHTAVAAYVKILIVGTSIGALGFIPNVLLIARGQYRFIAKASTAATVLVLGSTAIAAARGDVSAVCVVYACYHIGCALVFWVRAQTLDEELHRAIAPLTPIALLISSSGLAASLLFSHFAR